MDDLKLYAKNESKLGISCKDNVQTYSNDTGIEFGISQMCSTDIEER